MPEGADDISGIPSDRPADRQLADTVYEHLRSMAGNQLRGERRDHTLSATALVNEAYLRIASDSARSLRAVLRFLRLSGTNAQRNAP